MDKLQNIIQQLDLVNYQDDLNGSFLRVSANKQQSSWKFYFEFDELIPFTTFDLFTQRLCTYYVNDHVLNIYYHITYKNQEFNFDQVILYFKNLVLRSSIENTIKSVLLERKLHYSSHNQLLTIAVYNEIEAKLINDCTNQLKSLFINCGLNLDFEVVIDEQEIELDVSDMMKIVVEKPVEKEAPIVSSHIVFGKEMYKTTCSIDEIETNSKAVIVDGFVFATDSFATKNGSYLVTLKITDYVNSISCKLFIKDNHESLQAILGLKKGMWLRIGGSVSYDQYDQNDVLKINHINLIEKTFPKDNAEIKRAELHIHTNMSTLDSVINANDLFNHVKHHGYEAIGITDHSNVQAFPDIYNKFKNSGIKVLYGCEFNVVDDATSITFNNSYDRLIDETTFIVFDFETTGFNAHLGDSIIEFGACMVKQGQVIDTFSELVDPKRKLPAVITEVTGIKDEDLVGKRHEDQVVADFKEWIKDYPVVAHNAKFDYSFIKEAYEKALLGTFDNMVIDTLELSRALHPEWSQHNLKRLSRKYKIKLDNHHRALDDAIATSELLYKQLQEVKTLGIDNVNDLGKVIDKENVFKHAQVSHTTIMAQNQVGLKNLFKLVSHANTTYFHKTALLTRDAITKHREGLLIGSSCVNNELMQKALKYDVEAVESLIGFYDYIEVSPPDAMTHLIDTQTVNTKIDIIKAIKLIVEVANNAKKLVIASGDVHYLNKRDKILRHIIINSPVVGGGFHPLNRQSIKTLPDQHFYSTEEMLKQFDFLDNAYEIVVTNPLKLASMVEDVEVIKNELFTPKMEGSNQTVENMVYDRARAIYGNDLPEIVEKRIEKELKSIIGHSFDVIYLISHKIVKKSLDDGYLVGSRGSIGSSLVATFMDITEVNPLSPHYICTCQYSEFINDENYASGYDLPAKNCPKCGKLLKGEGHDIPFETFLGFDGDKVPDIDLNFSGDYQGKAHDYTKVLFGEDKVYRAGTISTLAQKTAFGYVKGYQNDKMITMRNAHTDYLVEKVVGVKRSTGQHPGGIIVIPDYMDVYDFTPVQFPADDTSSAWKTTHFDFHAIHDNVLKLDILGHDDPTVLHMLNETTGVDLNVDPATKEVISLFSSPEQLGINRQVLELENGTYEIFATGTLGIPEMGTRFVIEMLKDTKPATFAQLVKISGLSHGTDVWINNGQELIRNNVCEFKDVIGCRDDIMVYLMHRNLQQKDAFSIMENVRKGKGLTVSEEEIMIEHDVPNWYIDSCKKIKYMFPKAHATAYVLMACRIAYFKVFYPLHFYAAYFSVRADDFAIETMIYGEEAIRAKMIDILEKGQDATNKEINILNTLEIALEMILRGFSFSNISLDKSHATRFLIEGNSLIPPFKSVDGLGTTAAATITEQRDLKPFISIDDLKKRTRLTTNIMDKLNGLRVLEHLPEGDQLSLF